MTERQPARAAAVIVPSRKRPAELAIIATGLVLGASSVTGVATPATVRLMAVILGDVHTVFEWLLLLTAVLAAASTVIRDRLRSIAFERAGLLAMGILLVAYGVVALATAPEVTVGPLVWTILGAGALSGAWQLGRDVARFRTLVDQTRRLRPEGTDPT